MRKNIIAYDRVSEEVQQQLQKDYDISFFRDIKPKEDAEFLRKLKTTDGIIGLGLKVDQALLDHAPHLKIVSNVSTGYDNLDIPALTKRNIMATNTPGIVEKTTADAIFGILLGTARKIPELDFYVKGGHWNKSLTEESYGINVHNKTLGIIGMGKVGSQIAKRAHWGFDMDILYYNRSRKPEAEKDYGAHYCDMDTLLRKSDFVCLMTPLTQETVNLIGEREFKLMDKNAIFVNGSRGKTVNEADLFQALNNQDIRAAGLDVYQEEPINSNNPLLTLDNVVTTPHIGSSTIETELEMSKLAAKNLTKGLEGECPPNLINTDVRDTK